MKTVVIQGSARSDGHTALISQEFRSNLDAHFIDLKHYSLDWYRYNGLPGRDDFDDLIRSVQAYDLAIYITPVYWYAMSGIMKNFFDRITDVIQADRVSREVFRGKSMAAVACGSDRSKIPGFFNPFSSTAGYLGMSYIGSLHTWVDNGSLSPEVRDSIRDFTELIRK